MLKLSITQHKPTWHGKLLTKTSKIASPYASKQGSPAVHVCNPYRATVTANELQSKFIRLRTIFLKKRLTDVRIQLECATVSNFDQTSKGMQTTTKPTCWDTLHAKSTDSVQSIKPTHQTPCQDIAKLNEKKHIFSRNLWFVAYDDLGLLLTTDFR